MEREKSRSNSIVAFPANHINKMNVNRTPQDSLPPSPPSDDLMYTLSRMMVNKTPNKLSPHITTHSSHIAKITKMSHSDKSMSSEDSTVTVSSSPSLLEETNTTTRTQIITKGHHTKKDNDYQYQSRQQWTALMHGQPQKRRAIHEENLSSKKKQHHTFGSISTAPQTNVDPDKIRISLKMYDEQKGQELEELFRPKKSCCACSIL